MSANSPQCPLAGHDSGKLRSPSSRSEKVVRHEDTTTLRSTTDVAIRYRYRQDVRSDVESAVTFRVGGERLSIGRAAT